ncbi:Protein of uncharacterised function (DUF416) [Hafnia alvei]|uniref:Protein of uncharacterized function (DUF416) n=1 Tax=Hafnia alvei TaxID=569 RepID=A0A377PG32_HAFAL|nr:Protein of uncharacterised function (DUF416) [Hafnia alvei]
MLRNPIHKRLEKLESWQHLTFIASLCERMYPNYQAFCLQTGFGDPMVLPPNSGSDLGNIDGKRR